MMCSPADLISLSSSSSKDLSVTSKLRRPTFVCSSDEDDSHSLKPSIPAEKAKGFSFASVKRRKKKLRPKVPAKTISSTKEGSSDTTLILPSLEPDESDSLNSSLTISLSNYPSLVGSRLRSADSSGSSLERLDHKDESDSEGPPLIQPSDSVSSRSSTSTNESGMTAPMISRVRSSPGITASSSDESSNSTGIWDDSHPHQPDSFDLDNNDNNNNHNNNNDDKTGSIMTVMDSHSDNVRLQSVGTRQSTPLTKTKTTTMITDKKKALSSKMNGGTQKSHTFLWPKWKMPDQSPMDQVMKVDWKYMLHLCSAPLRNAIHHQGSLICFRNDTNSDGHSVSGMNDKEGRSRLAKGARLRTEFTLHKVISFVPMRWDGPSQSLWSFVFEILGRQERPASLNDHSRLMHNLEFREYRFRIFEAIPLGGEAEFANTAADLRGINKKKKGSSSMICSQSMKSSIIMILEDECFEPVIFLFSRESLALKYGGRTIRSVPFARQTGWVSDDEPMFDAIGPILSQFDLIYYAQKESEFSLWFESNQPLLSEVFGKLHKFLGCDGGLLCVSAKYHLVSRLMQMMHRFGQQWRNCIDNNITQQQKSVDSSLESFFHFVSVLCEWVKSVVPLMSAFQLSSQSESGRLFRFISEHRIKILALKQQWSELHSFIDEFVLQLIYQQHQQPKSVMINSECDDDHMSSNHVTIQKNISVDVWILCTMQYLIELCLNEQWYFDMTESTNNDDDDHKYHQCGSLSYWMKLFLRLLKQLSILEKSSDSMAGVISDSQSLSSLSSSSSSKKKNKNKESVSQFIIDSNLIDTLVLSLQFSHELQTGVQLMQIMIELFESFEMNIKKNPRSKDGIIKFEVGLDLIKKWLSHFEKQAAAVVASDLVSDCVATAKSTQPKMIQKSRIPQIKLQSVPPLEFDEGITMNHMNHAMNPSHPPLYPGLAPPAPRDAPFAHYPSHPPPPPTAASHLGYPPQRFQPPPPILPLPVDFLQHNDVTATLSGHPVMDGVVSCSPAALPSSLTHHPHHSRSAMKRTFSESLSIDASLNSSHSPYYNVSSALTAEPCLAATNMKRRRRTAGTIFGNMDEHMNSEHTRGSDCSLGNSTTMSHSEPLTADSSSFSLDQYWLKKSDSNNEVMTNMMPDLSELSLISNYMNDENENDNDDDLKLREEPPESSTLHSSSSLSSFSCSKSHKNHGGSSMVEISEQELKSLVKMAVSGRVLPPNVSELNKLIKGKQVKVYNENVHESRKRSRYKSKSSTTITTSKTISNMSKIRPFTSRKCQILREALDPCWKEHGNRMFSKKLNKECVRLEVASRDDVHPSLLRNIREFFALNKGSGVEKVGRHSLSILPRKRRKKKQRSKDALGCLDGAKKNQHHSHSHSHSHQKSTKEDCLVAQPLYQVLEVRRLTAESTQLPVLIGQRGVVAKQDIPKHSVLCEYFGIEFTTLEFDELYENTTERDIRFEYAFEKSCLIPSEIYQEWSDEFKGQFDIMDEEEEEHCDQMETWEGNTSTPTLFEESSSPRCSVEPYSPPKSRNYKSRRRAMKSKRKPGCTTSSSSSASLSLSSKRGSSAKNRHCRSPSNGLKKVLITVDSIGFVMLDVESADRIGKLTNRRPHCFFNDCRSDLSNPPTKEDEKRYNTDFLFVMVNGWTHILAITKRDIKMGEELMVSYGDEYHLFVSEKKVQSQWERRRLESMKRRCRNPSVISMLQ